MWPVSICETSLGLIFSSKYVFVCLFFSSSSSSSLFAIRHSCSLTCWEMSSHIWSFQGEYRGRNLERRCSTGILIWQAGKNMPPSAWALPQCPWRQHRHHGKSVLQFLSGGAGRALGWWGRKRVYTRFCCSQIWVLVCFSALWGPP